MKLWLFETCNDSFRKPRFFGKVPKRLAWLKLERLNIPYSIYEKTIDEKQESLFLPFIL